jgi:DnaJ-class molecular chaperone
MRDPYEVLGVARTAEAKDIKRAYRKLARQHHPDLHPGDKKAEERFKEVAGAYDLLSDPDKKGKYDRGEIDPSGAPKAERRFYREYAEKGADARYADPAEFLRDFEGSDIFADLFRGTRRNARKMRGSDVRQEAEIEFLDAVNGGPREIRLADGRRLKVTIPPGAKDGQVLRLKGQGSTGPPGGAPGDMLLELKVRSDPRYTRKDDDIYAELPVTLPEAVLGARIDVPTVDGIVTVTVPKGSNAGDRLRIRGKGAATAAGGRGDHYVTLKIMLPDRPDPEFVRWIEEWSARHPYAARGR